MAKSVACGDYPDIDKENFMRKNMIYLDKTLSDQQLLDIISNALKNKQNLQKMANDCYDYFTQKYSFEEGLKDFDKIFDKIN